MSKGGGGSDAPLRTIDHRSRKNQKIFFISNGWKYFYFLFFSRTIGDPPPPSVKVSSPISQAAFCAPDLVLVLDFPGFFASDLVLVLDFPGIFASDLVLVLDFPEFSSQT